MTSQPCDQPDEPITLKTLSLTPTSKKVQETFFGKIRAFSTITTFEWAYLGISLLGLTAAAGLTIERLIVIERNTRDFAFGLYFLLTILFCCYYVTHAVLTLRGDELLVYVICNIIVLIYCAVNYSVGVRTTIKFTRLVLVCVMSWVLIPAGLYLIYKYFFSNLLAVYTVGGTQRMQKAHFMYYLCSNLLKFHLQLQLTVLILVRGNAGSSITLAEELVLGFSVLFTIVFIVLGFVGLFLENKKVMIGFFFLGLFEPGYVGYKFVYAMFRHSESGTYESTFIIGSLALLVWFALMCCTGHHMKRNFHIGLKEQIFGHWHRNTEQEQPLNPLPAGNSLSSPPAGSSPDSPPLLAQQRVDITSFPTA